MPLSARRLADSGDDERHLLLLMLLLLLLLLLLPEGTAWNHPPPTPRTRTHPPTQKHTTPPAHTTPHTTHHAHTLRYINGFPDRPPVRPNISLGDSLAGLHAAFGTVMALLHRERWVAGGCGVCTCVCVCVHACAHACVHACASVHVYVRMFM